ncbi:hypothetical protein [Massilia sp. TWR1-2-2]|uniref:hypothetical protein n=1 Tax=Massilia sp. TWR1-2-2 TaxID=2804584 RepID=UPI003CFBA4CF
MVQRLAELFTPPPLDWELRGDPYLWADLANILGDTLVESPSTLRTLLERSIAGLIGSELDGDGDVLVAKYANGGLSDGRISRGFWRGTAIPMLVKRVKISAPRTHDYFAELYVAGLFGDHGWAIYFPKRDVGFDFIASKEVNGQTLLRPVQVKGLYPTEGKLDKSAYGFRGPLTAVHPDMVLAMPFFAASGRGVAPACVAYMPVPQASKDSPIRCQPARLIKGIPQPRVIFAKFFDQAGLIALEDPAWADQLEEQAPLLNRHPGL